MPGEILHQTSGVHSSRSLVVRAGLARTFGSLAGFLVVSFLCWGIYILEDAFADPLNAGAAAVIWAAFVIAVGAILLFYLLKAGPAADDRSSHAVAARASLRSSVGAVQRTDLRNNLAYQRFYVDHSRIRQ